jgi:hypothetical protein
LTNIRRLKAIFRPSGDQLGWRSKLSVVTWSNRRRASPEELALTRARLGLVRGVAQVLRNGLGLFGVAAPESM